MCGMTARDDGCQLALYYPILSYLILSYPALSYAILSYAIQSYRSLSYPITSYPIQSLLSQYYHFMCDVMHSDSSAVGAAERVKCGQ